MLFVTHWFLASDCHSAELCVLASQLCLISISMRMMKIEGDLILIYLFKTLEHNAGDC
jgi:hypothetical protein